MPSNIRRNIGIWLLDNNHNCLRNGFAISFSNGCNERNFVETISLYRIIISSLPRRCLGESPKICVVDKQSEGYELKIKKCITKKCCTGCCLKNFSVNNNLRLTEDKNYLTIHSPWKKDNHKTSGTSLMELECTSIANLRSMVFKSE